MKNLYLLVCFATVAQSCFAGGSLSEELAAERGIKLVNVDLLGKSKSATVKPQIMSCDGAPVSSKTTGSDVLQNKDGKMVIGSTQPAPAREFDVEKMKESLMDVSRQAANSRYQAAKAQGGKKKTCNVNLTE
ncbi:hypothetical protein ACO0LL_06975 [Undibacterium sp. TC4M20W]|uniref:hypothetical protein n=1 Tax=Undibacterium sp. TC4M20W TaxID=3413052 RepID=UPI003BF41923